MISIIVPVYNTEQYIQDLIISLEDQTYKDFEVIFVDDGSTDNSVQKIKQYADEAKFKYMLIKQEHKSTSATRNNGIAKSSGEYICFVDSDDILDSKYLESLYMNLVKYDADISVINKCEIAETDHSYINKKSGKPKLNILSKNQALTWLLKGKLHGTVWELMIKRAALHNLLFAEGFEDSEDLEMSYKLFASNEKIIVSDAPLYGYRLRNNSMMSIIDSRRLHGLFLIKNLEFFIGEHAPDFLSTFKKYGVARWLWTVLWQEALACNKYEEFNKSICKYGDLSSVKNLIHFPDIKVRCIAVLFCISPRLYHRIVRLLLVGRYRDIKHIDDFDCELQ